MIRMSCYKMASHPKTRVHVSAWGDSINGLEASLITVSVQGEFHRKRGEPNQDASLGFVSDQLAIAAVADGLGSSRHADIGARIAVESVLHHQPDVLEAPGAAARIVDSWRFGLPKGKEKDYDTTLLFAMLRPESLTIGQIGDGLVQWRIGDKQSGAFQNLENGFANQTDSLGSAHAESLFRIRTIPVGRSVQPVVVVMATDGISVDLDPDLQGQLAAILLLEHETNTLAETASLISDWVENWQTACHMDDRTIAVMIVRSKEEHIEG